MTREEHTSTQRAVAYSTSAMVRWGPWWKDRGADALGLVLPTPPPVKAEQSL